MTLYFLSPDDISNYKTDIKRYTHEPLLGKHCTTVYTYWILKNRGYDVSKIGHGNDAPAGAPIFFHYDDKHLIDTDRNAGIQFVSDRPIVEGCDVYISCNRSLITPKYNTDLINKHGIENYLCKWVDERWIYAPHPFPQGIVECDPVWPPTVFGYYGREHTLINDINSDSFVEKMKSHDIHLQFSKYDHNKGNEHVTFCIRDHTHVSSTVNENNIDSVHGHKHAGRLFQTWYMGIPGIFETNSAMLWYRKSNYDFLIADTIDEFEEACIRLKNDKSLYMKMVQRCNEMAGTGVNDEYVKLLVQGLNGLGIPLTKQYQHI